MLEAMLAKTVEGDQRGWDDVLPLVMLAYRSSVHESIIKGVASENCVW